MRQLGTVKWYRGDGTGYIVGDDGVTRYVDRSVLVDDTEALQARDRVSFAPSVVLGRKVAMEVSLMVDNGCADCGAPADDGDGWDGRCGNCADRVDPARD